MIYIGNTQSVSISFLFLFFFHQSSLYPIKIFAKCFYLLVINTSRGSYKRRAHINAGSKISGKKIDARACNRSYMVCLTDSPQSPAHMVMLILRTRVLRMAAVTTERYEIESVVRGHHIYKTVLTPVIGEELLASTSCSFWLRHSRIPLASTVKCLAASLLHVLDCLSFKVTSYALRFDISRSVLTGTQN